MQFEVGEIERALYAKVVKKCGNRNHWEDWAKDIAKIAQTHITRITTIVNNPDNEREVTAFNAFADELRDDLNDSITNDEVVEMLAQHLITKPVFDALFDEYNFASNNPVSKAMQHLLNILQAHRLDKEADTLDKFYASVKMRAEGIGSAEAKQKIVVELYDKFFKNAFPRMTERLGIVYTPVEVVDFIIHSVNDVLKSEFGQTLGSENVHIIDPFTGTGTFITRLMQSGLITKEQLPHKYKNEIHANEIVLLAYYIAAINIEAVYHSIVGGKYEPFEGICLTDTFQLYEKDDLISKLLVDNSARRVRQKKLDIRVIMGNPPYSAKQKTGNDGNQNVAYPHLDETIRQTYVSHSKATNNNAVYDSYIRAIRWASDRIKANGVMAFISGSAWIDKPFADGMRKCLQEEFTNLYVFNLRGDIRKNIFSKGLAKEGENIFSSGSMTGISISIFVKNPDAKKHGQIYYHDIGDDLTEIQKLEIITGFKSINGITEANGWDSVTPDKHHDWLNQRDDRFYDFIEIGNKKDKSAITIFENYTRGLETNRDSWCYNYGKKSLENNMRAMSDFYNDEVRRYKNALENSKAPSVDNFIEKDHSKISWHRGLKHDLKMLKEHVYNIDALRISTYRVFSKQWVYFGRDYNAYINQMPQIFPKKEMKNKVIIISGASNQSGVFTAYMSDSLPDLNIIQASQCFPLKLYEKIDDNVAGGLFATQKGENGYHVKDGITNAGLEHFKDAYPNEPISKEDIFYYTYGLLHSEDYRSRFADNLSKQLPRIACVKKTADFWAFVGAGRQLGALHVDYETIEPYPVTIEGKPQSDVDYYVTKMKFGKKGKEKDKTTVLYNEHITIKDIPLEAYDYIVNGKAALDWVMDRQCVKTDKKSGITNDANLYATETVGNAKYPLELFKRVITVSIETMKIVKALPKLDI